MEFQNFINDNTNIMAIATAIINVFLLIALVVAIIKRSKPKLTITLSTVILLLSLIVTSYITKMPKYKYQDFKEVLSAKYSYNFSSLDNSDIDRFFKYGTLELNNFTGNDGSQDDLIIYLDGTIIRLYKMKNENFYEVVE